MEPGSVQDSPAPKRRRLSGPTEFKYILPSLEMSQRQNSGRDARPASSSAASNSPQVVHAVSEVFSFSSQPANLSPRDASASSRAADPLPRLNVRAMGPPLVNPGTYWGTNVINLEVFPEYIQSCIRRVALKHNEMTAAITMKLMPDTVTHVMRCIMSLEILPHKVERLAMILFSAHLETNGTVRELILPNMAAALVDQLQGCSIRIIRNVFGNEIGHGITTSPAYLKERAQGLGFTRCIFMNGFTNPHGTAFLNFELGFPCASATLERMFPN